MHVGGLLIAGGVGLLGYVYNAVVDKYGDYKVSQWTYEKIPLDIRSTNSSSSRSDTDADADSDEGRIEFVTKSVNELR